SSAATNLPSHWSKTENVFWVAPLPGHSGATPVIWNDTIFVPSPDAQKNLLLLCFDRATGKLRWQRQIGTGDCSIGKNNMASPSASTDGTRVFAVFATGDLAAFDFSGKLLWSRNLVNDYGKFANMWGYGSSPLLYKDRLYVQVLQRNPPTYSHAADDKPERESFLLCLDPATGKNLWRHIRKTDALEESKEAYTTPIPYTYGNRAAIIVLGGDYVTGHDPATGEELWRCGGLNRKKRTFWRTITSPVTAPGFVYACAPKGDPLLAVRADGSGLVTDTDIAWTATKFTPDVCTPLYYQGKLWVLDGDHQEFTCYDAATGHQEWRGNLGVREVFSASPIGADGKIYCLSEQGTAVVLEAGPEFKILSTIPMGEQPCMSSVAIAHGQLFIRTAQHLYCVGLK
ncbi:MAG: PQQ-binding-like beta-propeller repeat protein, partial [Candidatus Omnitrophica bacterium]|nr:PQQ-binding-like beta-propeller repeat protein [Candidatus Omnitrophota bacterium]